MQITPGEIDSVDVVGTLDGNPVKMVRLIGGLYCTVGKRSGSKNEEVLGAASHSAICLYNVEKAFKNFIPSLMKSESEQVNVVGYTELLPNDLKKSGYEIFMLEDIKGLSFTLAKNGIEKASFKGQMSDDTLKLSKSSDLDPSFAAAFSRATAQIAARKALFEGKEFVEFEGVKLSSSKVAKG